MDAINKLFAEFELAYHNQYYKAYADEERLILAKKYWLSCLSGFSPQQIVAAARQLVLSSDYLPTVSAMVRVCEQGFALFGLPEPREAYVEACRAPTPKAGWQWSHQAVYEAGKLTGWHFLASEPEDRVFPVFSRYYQQLCQRVMRGETLQQPVPLAISEKPPVVLSVREQQERLAALRRKLDI